MFISISVSTSYGCHVQCFRSILAWVIPRCKPYGFYWSNDGSFQWFVRDIYIYMSKEQNTPYHTVVFGRSLEIIWHAFNARLWKTIRSDVCMGYAVWYVKRYTEAHFVGLSFSLSLFLSLSPCFSVSMHPEAEEGNNEFTKNEIRRHDLERYLKRYRNDNRPLIRVSFLNTSPFFIGALTTRSLPTTLSCVVKLCLHDRAVMSWRVLPQLRLSGV